MTDIRARVRLALERGYLMSLATVDDGGPWVSDVIYVFDDDLNVYWMSDPDVRHSKAIANDARVAVSITANARGDMNLGVQVAGMAEKIDGPRHDLAVKHFAKRNKPAPAPEDDVLQGDAWYVLRPSLIELIDEEHFGFTKQKLALA